MVRRGTRKTIENSAGKEITDKAAIYTVMIRYMKMCGQRRMNRNMSFEKWKKEVKRGICTDAGNCPVTSLLVMLQGKWKFRIIYEMCMQSPVRFCELRNNIRGITNTMLTSSLRELERDGLISRIQYNEIPPRVEYSLTEKGEGLLPMFYTMTQWGLKYIP